MELDPGGVVWVKCGTHYWPGEVKAFDDLPQHVKKDFDPEDEKPKLIVKFFDEDGYEFLEDTKGVFPYNCSKKEEFIKKGLVKSRRTSKEGSSWFAKFPNDIVRCEILTKGDPNILEKEPYIEKNEKVNYKEIFKSSTESVPLSKRRKRSSSSLASPSSKKPKNSDAVNSPKRGRRIETTPTPPRPISHPRFKPGAAGASDHKIKILPQPSSPYHLDLAMKQEKAAQSPSNNYTCSICGFSASRLNVIILHNKSHANQSASSGRQSGSPMMQRSKNGLETSSRHTQEPKKLSKKSTVAQVKKTSQDKKSPPKKPRMTKKLKEIKAKEEEEMKVERRNKILNDWSDDEDNEGGNKIDDPAVEENWDDEEMEIYMGDDNLHQNCSEDENEAIECDNKDTINSKSTKTPGGSMSPKNNDLPDDTTEQHNPSQNTNKSSKTKEHESVNKLCVEGDEVQDKTDTTMGSKGAQEEHQMSQSKLESDGAEIINEPSTKMLKDSELDEGTFKVSGKYDKIDSSDNADDKSEDSSDSSDNTKHHIVSLSSSTEETVKDSQVTPSETDFSELNSKNVQTPHSQLNDEEEISNSVSSELDKKLDYEPVQDEETFKYSAGNSKSCEYERPVKESSVCNNVNSSSDLKIIEEAESTNSKENHKDVTTSESFEEKKVLKNGSYDETESPSSSNSNIDAPDVIDINKVLEETRVPSLPKDLKDISEVEDSRKKSLCVKVMQPTSNLTDPWDVQDEFMKDQEGASKKRKEADEDAVSTTTPSEKNEKNQPDSSSRNENSSEEQSKNELDGKTIMAVIPNGNESTLAVVGEDNKVFAITGDCKGELTSTQQLLQGEEETYILLVDDGSGTVDSLNSQTLYIDPSSLASGDYSNMVLMTSSTSTGSTKESSNKDILALAIQQQQIVTTVDTTGGVVVVPGIASSSGLTKIPLISTQATPSAPIMTPDVLSSQVPGVPDSTSPNLSSKNIQKSV